MGVSERRGFREEWVKDGGLERVGGYKKGVERETGS